MDQRSENTRETARTMGGVRYPLRERHLAMIGASLGLCVAVRVASAYGLHWVGSGSVPVGIYRSVSVPIMRGSYVAVCLPDEVATFGKARGYLHDGECANGSTPVVKRVVAMAGDLVETRQDGVKVNGTPLQRSAVLTVDRQGRALTPILGWRRL